MKTYIYKYNKVEVFKILILGYVTLTTLNLLIAIFYGSKLLCKYESNKLHNTKTITLKSAALKQKQIRHI